MMDEDIRIESGEPERMGLAAILSRMPTRLLWTFVSPQLLYPEIDRRPSWWQPWVWVSLLSIVGVKLFAPVQTVLVKLNPRGVSQEELQQTLDAMDKFYILGYVTTPIFVFVQVLIFSLVGYLAVGVLSTHSNFKRYFTLFFYSYIIVSVGSVLSTILVRLRGLETIRSSQDAMIAFGLGFLVPEGHGFLDAIASSINVFSVWASVIVVLGTMELFGLTKKQGIIAILPVWVLYFIFALVSAKIGNMI